MKRLLNGLKRNKCRHEPFVYLIEDLNSGKVRSKITQCRNCREVLNVTEY